MKKIFISFCLLSLSLVFVPVGTYPLYADEKDDDVLEEYLFNEKNPLKKWKLSGLGTGEIDVVDRGSKNQCIRISKTKPIGFTYISKEIDIGKDFSGTLIFEAEIRSEDIKRGKSYFNRGKFQAVIVVDGVENRWPDSDFDGTFDFNFMRFPVDNLDSTETVILRLGIQDTNGTMWVDNVKIRHKP